MLADFNLRKADRNINFGSVDSEPYKVDLEEGNKNEYTPPFSQIDGLIKSAAGQHSVESNPRRSNLVDDESDDALVRQFQTHF